MNQPKIILWDLETMTDLEMIMKRVPGLGNWPGRTLKGDMMSIICFGYKYLGEDKTHCLNSWDFSDDINDDTALVHMAYEILKDADCIVTHNGKKFDVKILNTRLAKYGLPPLPKVHHADTKVIAKRALSLYSNSLGEVAGFLGVAGKLENGGWDLWVRVMKGDKEAKKLMVDYCKQDVRALENVFLKLRQYAKPTEVPNYNMFDETGGMNCPTCGSDKIQKHGVRNSTTRRIQRYRCLDCGSTHSLTATGLRGEGI